MRCVLKHFHDTVQQLSLKTLHGIRIFPLGTGLYQLLHPSERLHSLERYFERIKMVMRRILPVYRFFDAGESVICRQVVDDLRRMICEVGCGCPQEAL